VLAVALGVKQALVLAKISAADKGTAPAHAKSSQAHVQLIDEDEEKEYEEEDDIGDDVEVADDDVNAEHVVLDEVA